MYFCHINNIEKLTENYIVTESYVTDKERQYFW